jgi:hypothetical protein
MACGGCGQARQQFVSAVRNYNPRAAVQAVRNAVQINVDKLSGMSPAEVDRKWGGSKTPVVKAAPYKRTT